MSAGKRLADRCLEVEVAQPNGTLPLGQVGQRSSAPQHEQTEITFELVLLLVGHDLALGIGFALAHPPGDEGSDQTGDQGRQHTSHDRSDEGKVVEDELADDEHCRHGRVDEAERRIAAHVLRLGVGANHLAAPRHPLHVLGHLLVQPERRLGLVPKILWLTVQLNNG